MSTPLTDTEIYLIDKLIPKLKISDEINLNMEFRKLGDEEREHLATMGCTNPKEPLMNIAEFLKTREFVRSHDRVMYFLTEKGKNFKRAGSYQGYIEYQQNTRLKNREIIHTIETRGYLEQDEIKKNRRMEMIRKYVIYPAITILIIIAAVAVASHFKLIPKIKIPGSSSQ